MARRIGAVAVVLAALGVVPLAGKAPPAAASENLSRFASLTLGPQALALPGRLPDPLGTTSYRTPNGWLLRPAGRQIDTPRAPTGVTVSPDHRTVYVVNSGIFDEQLVVVDAVTLTRTLSPATDLYLGVVADAAGNVWASGGSRNRVFHFRAAGPLALPTRHAGAIPGTPNNGIPVAGYPGNLALGGDGRLYVAGNLSIPIGGCPGSSRICSVVSVVDVSDPLAPSPAVRQVRVGRDAYGIALHPTAGRLYVSNWADETNPARGGSGTVSVVDVSTPGAEHEVAAIPVGHHPTGLAISPDGRTLAVANSADDTVSLLDLDASGSVTAVRTVPVRTTPDAPRGATPLAVAFSPDGSLLFVALAGQNAVEVLRAPSGAPLERDVVVEGRRLHVPHTYIPTGWYPSAMAAAPHPTRPATRLYVTNLKGIGAGPGLNGQAEPLNGTRTQGTLSVIDLPSDPHALASALDAWTASVVENNRWLALFDSGFRDAASDPCLPAPLPGGGQAFSRLLCPATRAADGIDPRSLHVVYVVKENKTFDQYFGDIRAFGVPDADADPTWLLYGENVTTNQHLLAATFTLSDAFWADSEQSTTGHSWTSAGYATEYNEITWNTEYDQGLRGNRWSGQYDGQFTGPRDAEVAGQEGELFEPATRLVDRAKEAGLEVRIYSDDLGRDSPARDDQMPLSMWGIGASSVSHGRDLDFPDTDRVALLLHGETVSLAWTLCGVPCTSPPQPPPSTFGRMIGLCGPDHFAAYCGTYAGSRPTDYQHFTLDAWTAAYQSCLADGNPEPICQRAMPNLIYLALPVDHTLGLNPLQPTPQSMVADNDYATGLLIEALSRSPFWRNTLVLITEDDTQTAGDHVDAHRTFLLTAGGLARRLGAEGRASHQPGSFPSILKTVEVLFGLEPLTVYDRAAVPLHDVVVQTPAEVNSVPYTAVKPPVPFARNPADGPLARLSAQLDWRRDRADPQVLRDLLYAAIRGWPLPERYAPLLVPER